MKTFFEHVAERGQAVVGRELDVPKAIISRSARVETGINEDLIATCEKVWGTAFDRVRTLSEWYERWAARRADPARPSDRGTDVAHTPAQEA